MAASFIQSKANGASATSITVTLDAEAQLGSLIVVGARAGGNQSPNTPTDNGSGGTHTYTAAIAEQAQGAIRARMWYTLVTKTGTTQITVTVGSSTFVEVQVMEFGGVKQSSPLGVAGTGSGGSGTSLSVSAISPTAGSLIAVFATAGAAEAFTAGTDYTLANDGNLTGTEYRLVSTTSETAPFTMDVSAAWIEIAAEFLPAPSSRMLVGVGS